MVLANPEEMIKYCPECKMINVFHRQEFNVSEGDSEIYSCGGCKNDFSKSYIISYDSRRRLNGYRKRFRS